jgi:16S rRNA (cytosine967-C5)-methyltransferase
MNHSQRKISPARRAAFEALRRVEDEGAYSSVLLAQPDEALSARDRALCHELTLGVLRWQLWLDKLAEHYSGRAADAMDAEVRRALRLGLYQVRFLERVPESAAVNEAVNLVYAGRKRGAAGFVNAVLRRAVREKDFDPAEGIENPAERLAVRTSHPVWLIENWVRQFGFELTAAFAEANNSAPPLVFRLGRVGRDCLAALRESGALLTPAPLAPDSWLIDKMTPQARELAAEGWIYWQDEASQLVAHALEAQPGERILDLCAAPGSKTTHIAALQPAAEIVACDVHEHRLRLVREAAARQGLTNIETRRLDATPPLPFPPESFGRVLVDAPCSGTGTLRRNPEIRWRITDADIRQLARQQATLLQRAAQMVKPGGRLVYATCSVERAENEEVLREFYATHPQFQPVAPNVPTRLHTAPGQARVWPQRDGADGFFLAVFDKKTEGAKRSA